MGGMQTWIWAQKYPDFMDVAVPMASLPTEMSGRNWMMRRLIIDSIRNDPEWMNGNYTKQPRSAAVRLGLLRRSPPAAATRRSTRRRRRARRPTSCSTSAWRAVHRRRQRRPVPVGLVARLQPLAGPGAHPGARCWRSTRPTTSATRPSCGIPREGDAADRQRRDLHRSRGARRRPGMDDGAGEAHAERWRSSSKRYRRPPTSRPCRPRRASGRRAPRRRGGRGGPRASRPPPGATGPRGDRKSVAWLRRITPSSRMRRWLSRSVEPVVVMSAMASAVRFLTVPSVAPWLSTSW